MWVVNKVASRFRLPIGLEDPSFIAVGCVASITLASNFPSPHLSIGDSIAHAFQHLMFFRRTNLKPPVKDPVQPGRCSHSRNSNRPGVPRPNVYVGRVAVAHLTLIAEESMDDDAILHAEMDKLGMGSKYAGRDS